MGNKQSSRGHQADRSISWQPDPGWINGPRRRASFTYPTDPTISQLNGFAPPPFLWPPPFQPAPFQNGHSPNGDENGSKMGSVTGRYLKKDSRKAVKSNRPDPTDSGYFTQGNMTDSEKSAQRAKLRGSRLSLNEAAFVAAQSNEEFHPEPNGIYRHPTFNYPGSHVVEPLYLPYMPPPSESFKQSSNKGKKKRLRKSSKKEVEYPPIMFGQYGSRPVQMGPYGTPLTNGQRSKSIDDLITQGMIMPYGPYGAPMGHFPPPQQPQLQQQKTSKRSSSIFDVSEIRGYNDIVTHTLNTAQPGLEYQKPTDHSQAETKPKAMESSEKNRPKEVPPGPQSKSISDTNGGQLGVGSRAEVVKISPEARKTMERNAVLLGLDSDFGLIPMPECAEPPAVKHDDKVVPQGSQQPKAQLPANVIGGHSTSSEADEIVDVKEAEEVEILPTIRTVLPRLKVAKPQDFDTLSAWKNIPIHSSYSRLNSNTSGYGSDKDVIEERLNVKLVPTPPSKSETHGGEPIYLEHGERLPEFKKRLIETGSFDFAEAKNNFVAYSEEKSSWPNKSLNNSRGRSIDRDLNVQTTAIPPPEPPLSQVIANDANNNKITQESMEPNDTDLSKRKEKLIEGKGSMRNLKNSITNLFQRSRNPSEKSKTSEMFSIPVNNNNVTAGRARSQEQMDRSRFNSLRSATPTMSLARPGDSSEVDFSWVYDLESKFRREKDTLDRQMDTIRQRGIYQGPPKPLVFSQEELRQTDNPYQLPRAHTSMDYNGRTPQPYAFGDESSRNCVSRNSERIEDFTTNSRSRRPESVRNFSPDYTRSEAAVKRPESVRNFSPEYGRSANGYRRPESVRNFSPDYCRSAADLSFTEMRGQSTPALNGGPRRGLTVYKRLENEVVGEESFDSPAVQRRLINFGQSPVRLNRIATPTLSRNESEMSRFPSNRSLVNPQRIPTPVLMPFENHVKLKAALFEQEAKNVNAEMDTRRHQISRLKYKSNGRYDDNYTNGRTAAEPFIPQPDYNETSQSNNLGPSGYPTTVGPRRNGVESSALPSYRRLGATQSPTPSLSADQARDELMEKVAADNRATMERSQLHLDRRYSSEFLSAQQQPNSFEGKSSRSQYVSETCLNRPLMSPADRNGLSSRERRSYFDDKLQNSSGTTKVYSRPLGQLGSSPRNGIRQSSSHSQVFTNGYGKQPIY